MDLNPFVKEVLYRDLCRYNSPFWEDDRPIQQVFLTPEYQEAYATHINNIVKNLLNEKYSDNFLYNGYHTYVGCTPNGDRDPNAVLFITLKRI